MKYKSNYSIADTTKNRLPTFRKLVNKITVVKGSKVRVKDFIKKYGLQHCTIISK